MLTITGQAAEVSINGISVMANLPISAYDRDDEVTPLASTYSDQLGNYMLTIPTSGKPFDGYVKARLPNYIDTYLYLPTDTLSSNYDSAPVRMATADTIALLDNLCDSSQNPGKGTIVAVATDAAHLPVNGVTFSTTPAANKYCYDGQFGIPDSVQLTTNTDGTSYMFNVTGPITVNATKANTTFNPRLVTVRPDVVTMVLVR